MPNPKIHSRHLIVILCMVFNVIQLSEPRCTPSQFTCRDGSCIENYQKCDRINDCYGGEDEADCGATCKDDEFSCKDGKCISELEKCDGSDDCADGSDEENCDADECDDFTCHDDSGCARQCDGITDCSDGSDEENCHGRCDITQFSCISGDCIDESLRCNHVVDCPSDASDEENCGICQDDEFDCGGGYCIQRIFVCDTFLDCPNKSDETNCTCDENTQFDCGNHACIPRELLCNTIPDCQNGADESPETCKSLHTCASNEHTCGDGTCVPSRNICDGDSQCSDGSDEANCGCQAHEYLCANGQCIKGYLHCNGIRDCQDGSDEVNCPTPAPRPVEPEFRCQPGYEMCRSGDHCYLRDRSCDGHIDCPDRSDESNCPAPTTPPQYPQTLNLKTYPNAQDIKESSFKLGREVVFQCRDEGPLRATVRWLRANGLPLPPGSRDNFGRLEIPNIQLEHSGTYICQARGFSSSTPGSQVFVNLNVEPYLPPPVVSPIACALHEATCSNGDCIPKSYVCNGKFDCSDGSDETRCSPHGCEPNEFRCANKRCVLKTWVCDSDDDCGDGSDEVDCGTNAPGSQCSNKQFRCHSGNQCIPKSFHCDSENDCVDRSDEIGCSPVQIITPPKPMVNLTEGSIFEITCTAYGVPTPEIVWRLNWGHIPEKCKTTSVNGTGVLTCPDIQESDQGAYSCEAINIRGSKLAIPDTILVVIAVRTDVCPPGFFNEEARTSDECIPCFCFGITNRCRSADIYTYQLLPPLDAHKVVGVNISPLGEIDVKDTPSMPQIRTRPTSSRQGVEIYLQQTDTKSMFVPYFVMPENYNSNQLKSYGGYFKYNVQYRGYGRPITYAPDIIITGNGYTLLHTVRNIEADRTQYVQARLFVGEWVKLLESGRTAPATREEIMMVLASVDNILIKLQHFEGHIDTTLDLIEMDSAGLTNVGKGKPEYVENCECPHGYGGLSCETCLAGYERSFGPWLGQCYKEERCPHGTYGDPSRGIPCRPCPCPHAEPPNQFTQTCSLGPGGEAICNCPAGYRGNRCEQCDTGYTGNPLIAGDYCKPIVDRCDPRGSISSNRDAYGQCPCKELTYGRNCDQCKSNTFHLSNENLFGCIACFCMGVTDSCKSSNRFRDTINIVFASSKQDFKIVTAEDLRNPTDQGITLDKINREIVFNNFTYHSSDVKYWSLPNRFLGDKITSYGGNLQYTVRYTPTPGGSSSRNTAPDVELVSRNQIRLSYYRHPQIEPNTAQTVTVPLLEQYWQRNDGQQADREHLLMALADVQAILIKATYTTNSQEVSLSSVSLDTAEDSHNGNPNKAYEVEHCDCPNGYVGLSCQDCAFGYKRASGGLYLGLCTKCECNGWSNECDAKTGVCFNCNGHRTGSYCDQCLQGYELNELGQCVLATSGCICDPRGSIMSTCYGGYCQCKQNVVGQTCNRCKEGTFGLNANLTEGCQSCFCSGVSTECSESNLYIEQIPSEIYSDAHNFTLTDQYSRNKITTGFQSNSALNEIGYFFRPSQSERLFWSLPRRFTGHRLTSYGGKLDFTQRFTQRPNAYYSLDQDIIISGNGITIYWTNEKHQQPDIANKISVVLSPAANWQRQDSRQGPRPASREDIMRVLANVDSILIRAQLSSDTASSFISDITLDTAVTIFTPTKAINVEVCRCPPGYRGTSCESCDEGYYRDINDIQAGPFGSCLRCPCSNHESSCEIWYNRVVCNCLPGYGGADCSFFDNVLTTPPPYPEPEPQPEPQPTIIVEIREPKLQIVQAGDTVRFHCQARSTTSNAVAIYWAKEEGNLPDRAVDDHEGLLVITEVRISDSGTYICEANDGVSIVSQHIDLTVGGNPPVIPHAQIYPSQVDVYEGEPFDLRCEASGNPIADIHWERENAQPFNREHTIVSGQLHIRKSVASDSGRYICRATNIAGSSTAYTTVIVRGIPNQVTEPIIKPEYYTGESGSSFTLLCETNEDYSTIKWEKQGGYLPYNHKSAAGTLIVTDARPEDSGIYVCIVTTSSGQSGSKTATVTITQSAIEDYPTVRITPKNQTAGQGAMVEMYCHVTGSPPPTIKWTRVHNDFGPNTHQVGSVLRINPATQSDRGIYVCVANNDHGIAQDSTILEVERRERPEVAIYPEASQVVNEGSDVQVICTVTAGIPQPFLTWSRRDGLALRPDFVQGSELRIFGVRTEDAAEYICNAANELGSASATATVVVNVPPRITLSHANPMSVRQGEYVRLECRADGHPLPTVQWRRHMYGHPEDVLRAVPAVDSTAVLEIASAQSSDEGVYTCQATNSGGTREEYIQLIVDTYPTRGDITGEDAGSDKDNYPTRPDVRDNEQVPNILDETMTAPTGTRAELRCRVDRYDQRYPIQMKWVRQNNMSLPYNSQTYGSTLYIDNVQPSDGGEYLCLGVDNSGSVRFSVTVKLVVLAVPRIVLEPPRQVVRPYEHAVIECKATGDQPIDIQWHAVGREMPSSVHVDRGLLEFRGIQVSDAGRYRCTARNPAGEADSVAEVLVDAGGRSPLPPAELTITPSSHEVKFGDHLDLQCRSNEPGVILTWSKVDDRLSNNVESYSGLLRFNSLNTENNGVYRCETRGPSGYYYRDYTVEIIETVQEPTAPPLDIQYAPQGESIYMECKTDLEEPVNYQWSKQGGELPRNIDPYMKQLRINDLTSDDAGTYVCSASNGRQTVNTPTVLVVTGIVPYFTQAPNSYLGLSTIPDHHIRMNFEISFKPESDYGLILYNGNNKRKDFLSLAITGGYIEFKFNLGHDTTTLISQEPVQIGKWHTVKIRRDKKTGVMYVDGKGPVTETGKGKYSTLTLTDPLYLGGVPNYHDIPSDIDIKSGFVGCISQLKVGHNYYDLLREASAKVGVTTCETCQENPCQNQGVCQESLTKEGFTCICTDGFSGPTCNKIASQSCTPYICGIGRCIDNEYSYECHCPLGHVGTHCEKEVSIYEPAFRKNAYVAYPPLKTPRRLRINLKIKPRDTTDGILMYSAQDSEGHGNFVSLAVKDRHVEFRYDVGNGPIIIRSDKELEVGEYVIITAIKSISEGKLMVTGGNIAVERFIGGAQPLSLNTPLFLGGINTAEITVNPEVGVTSGFNGCIGEFNVVGVELDIIHSATSSANVFDCSSINTNNEISNDINSGKTQYSHDNSKTGCSSAPCWNDGQCYPLSPTEYKCSCINGYSGHDCEITPNQCDQLRPCENGGTCEGTTTGYRCICPVDYQGTNCEQRQHIGNEANFEGNGYLEFDRHLLPHNSREEEVIALQLSTNSSNGLVFWQGQTPNEDGRGKDNIGLAVVDGYLLFTFTAGSGPVDIINDRIRVDDGKVHTVVLKRRVNYGSIEIDNEYLVKGEGAYRRDIEIQGNIYLGGTPNISLMTGRFSQGFVGCVHAFEVQDSHTIELGTKALSGINVKPCSSHFEEEIVN